MPRSRELGLAVTAVFGHFDWPPGTVPSQTKRGLALLRPRLAAALRHGTG